MMLNKLLRKFSLNTLRYSVLTTPHRQCSSNIDFMKLIHNNKIVVFMKGVPEKPRCGYSYRVCQILQMHEVNFDFHNVLESLELREGIKKFSNWPTIPQVFINGELIGGCDILLEMHRTGTLIEVLEDAGVKSALKKTDK